MTSETARALWVMARQQAEIRNVSIAPAAGSVTITTLFSGISRGTERLVFEGRVPPSEFDTMRAPFQEGGFDYPLKYGYAAVGVIEDGPRAGERVFALYPHQTRFALPKEAAIRVPDDVPAERAVLAANMETALNITWDAQVAPGDRVVVIGAGVVGALSAFLCARVPGTEVCLTDIDPSKKELARALGCDFALPEAAPSGADLVIHASASSAGLATALRLAGTEGVIVEASWYGTDDVTVPLGAAFHHRRLRIISSQVGRIPSRQTARWSYSRRLAKALDLLADPVLDHLISGTSTFEDIPSDYAGILSNPGTLCHRITYART